jgi:tetratricopeptide (TPR) repeat protein
MLEMNMSRRGARLGLLALAGALAVSGCVSTKDEEVQRLRARSVYEQGINNLAENRLSLSLAAFQEATQLDPDNPVYHNSLGVVFLNLHRAPEAEAEFQKAIRLDPSYAEAHHNSGLALAEQGRFADAIPAYRKAISLPIYPTPEIAYYNLGNAYFALKKTREAEEAFRASVQLNPKLAGAHYQLGLILTQAGRREEAKAAFRTARDIDPSSPFGRAAGEALKTLGEGG